MHISTEIDAGLAALSDEEKENLAINRALRTENSSGASVAVGQQHLNRVRNSHRLDVFQNRSHQVSTQKWVVAFTFQPFCWSLQIKMHNYSRMKSVKRELRTANS